MPGYSLADRVAAQEAVARRYPKEAVLRDNRTVRLRAMTAGDRDAMLEFARELPPNDLLFLRTNIAEPPVVNEWIANIAVGRTFTVVATSGDSDSIVGFVSLHYNQADWTRHLGEVLIITSGDFRSVGLGRLLAVEIYAAADALELKKLSAQMALDQPGARATFERLGFRPEALLTDFAIDAEGTTRDLLVMTYDLAGGSNST